MTTERTDIPLVDAIVIGRNEGARLVACLDSLQGQVRRIVYVDSGSTDGSIATAKAAGADVVELDMQLPFTAARARNAGMAALQTPEFVLFVDGDCIVRPDWIRAALDGFARHPAAVVICGRRRERFPDASVWNRLCDREWDTPIGEALACGGDALMRLEAVRSVGGYRGDLIAGEEPDLCLRLRRAGGQIWRIDAEMTLHDAAILRFGQWWRRTLRAGHAFAEGAALHGSGPERHWVKERQRALVWGFGVPAAGLAAGLVHPGGLFLLLLWPAQMVRLSLKWRDFGAGFFSVLGKVPEALGVLSYWRGLMHGSKRALIEYK